jgi:uncharacterized protein YcbK (DUF882 family)
MSHEPKRSGSADRRRFIAGMALYCASGVVGSIAQADAPLASDLERPIRSSRARSLSFLHTHTGERLSVDYFQDGQYQPGGLEQVNYLLRDFRNDEVHPIDPALLDTLFDLQTLAQKDTVFEVISGYRSPATNTMLRRTTEGVALHSMHLEGRAIDVRLARFPTATLARLARSLGRGGVGFYAASDFVHVDTGRVRSW